MNAVSIRNAIRMTVYMPTMVHPALVALRASSSEKSVASRFHQSLRFAIIMLVSLVLYLNTCLPLLELHLHSKLHSTEAVE